MSSMFHTRQNPNHLLVCVCVCVSHPGSKGYPPLHRFTFPLPLRPLSILPKAGGSRVCSWREPTKLQVQTRISKEDALSTYLQPELLTTLSNLLGLIPWFFMLPPPNPARPQKLRRRFDRCNLVTTMLNFSSDRTHAPFRSLAFLPIVAIESN